MQKNDKILNRYKVLDTIGSGGMGKVLKVFDEEAKKIVALKVLSDVRADAVEYFKREFRTLTKLQHPNLVEVYEFGTLEAGCSYFTMEFVQGLDIRQYVSGRYRGGRTADQMVLYQILVQVCLALDYVHSRKLVHGDIKPSNILISCRSSLSTSNSEVHDEGAADDRVVAKLVDFGLSRTVDFQEVSGLSGTVEYISPEMIKGEQVDGRSDLYSLGVVMYELIAQQPPFKGNVGDVLRQHICEEPELLRKRNPDVPAMLESIVSRLLAKNPARRYQSAYDVALAISELSDVEISVEDKEATESYVLSGKFVGRGKELERLMELWKNSPETSSFVLISGEPGIGKTRLMKEFKFSVQLEGGSVVSAQCSETVTQPFQPLKEVLRQVVRMSGHESDVLRRYASELSFLLPELLERFEIQRLPELDIEGEKLRLFNAVVDYIFAVAKQRNFVVIIDDLHLADSSTLEFLTYFARSLAIEGRKGIIFCGAFLGDESSRLSAVLGELGGSNYFEKIEIANFAPQETNVFVASMIGGESIDERLGKVIHRDTEGNPFFIEEVMKSLLEEGMVLRKRDGWEVAIPDVDALKLPTSVRDVLLKRIHHLDETSLEVLRRASVFTERFDADVLQFVSEVESEQLTEVLRKVEAVEIVSRTKNLYDFKNPRIRHILYEELDTEQKRNLHQRAAALYERLYASNLENHSELLAHHHYYAGDYHEALNYSIMSGDRAVRMYANSEAVKHYDRALHLVRQQDGESLPLEFDVLTKMMDVYDVLGYRDAEAEALEEMLIVATRLNDKTRLSEMYNRQARFLTLISQFERARKSAEKSLNLKREVSDRKGEGDALISLGFAHYRSGALNEFLDCYNKAVQVFDELECRVEEGNALVDVGYAHAGFLDTPHRALEYYDRALKIFAEAQYERGKARALGNSGLAHYLLGEYEKALECYQQTYEIFERIGDRRGLANCLNNMGLTVKTLGRYSQALEHLTLALSLMREVKDIFGERGCLEHLAIVYEEVGGYRRSLSYYHDALALAEQIGGKAEIGGDYQNIALVHHHLGDDATALQYLDKALTIAKETGHHELLLNTYFTYALVYLSRRQEEDLEAARNYAEEMIALAEKLSFRASKIELLSLQGVIYFELGNLDKALQCSSQAVGLLKNQEFIEGVEQEVYWHHYRILSAKSDEHATEYLEEAYKEVTRKSRLITEEDLRKSFLENVVLNRDILNAYHDFVETGEAMPAYGTGKEKSLATLYEVSKTINSILDLNTLLNKIMDLALETMHGERGLIFLLDEDELRLSVARNVEKETIQDATEISESIMRDVVAGGKPIIVTNAQEDERFKERQSVRNYQIVSLMCVPMRLKEKIIGTVYIDNRSGIQSLSAFLQPDVEFLEAFANLAAVAVENARLHEQLKAENVYLRKEVEGKFSFDNLIGQSKAMQRMYEVMQGAINSDGTVLIEGESGTGKELVAKAIHYHGMRKKGRFVAVDCAALTETLLDSELFGHRKGAFTGAVDDKIGLFEEGDGGTVFLDEITNTTPAFQAKLLRVLQEGEIRRVGEANTRKVDVRVIAATNKNIVQEVERGHFRQDLFYRLNVIPIPLPPLRERREDIPFLVQHFVEKYSSKVKHPIEGVTQELMDELMAFDWPGNVRELENLVNRMMIFAETDKLTVKSLPADFKHAVEKERAAVPSGVRYGGKVATLDELEGEHIVRTLERVKGNKTEAAKLLGLKRTTLIERMKKLKIA